MAEVATKLRMAEIEVKKHELFVTLELEKGKMACDMERLRMEQLEATATPAAASQHKAHKIGNALAKEKLGTLSGATQDARRNDADSPKSWKSC